jgi:hypothetical protein
MRIYDLAMTHKLDTDDFFIHRVQQHCAERGLNFFLIEPVWTETFLEKLRLGKVWPRVLLNMHSEHHQPEDVFHRIVRLAAERGVKVIDSPDVAQAAFDKARLHSCLVAAGFRVPFTCIVPHAEAAEFKILPEDASRLGLPFVIKPSLGYGKRGVILDATNETDLLRSMADWPDPNYLLQERITPVLINGEPAYWRLFYVFGSLWFCWWNCFTDRYRVVTADELARHGLEPLRQILCGLASLTGMNFFSTEVAQTAAGEFVLIDYVNDQCHMLTQSANPAMGVPDEVVAGIARRLVESAQRLIQAN